MLFASPSRLRFAPRTGALRRLTATLCRAALLAGLATCRDPAADRSAPGTGAVTRVEVAVPPGTITAGDTVQLTAGAFGRGGVPAGGDVSAWGSSDTTVATVSATGLLAARRAGVATVRATVGGVRGERPLTVARVAFAGVWGFRPASGEVGVPPPFLLALTERPDGAIDGYGGVFLRDHTEIDARVSGRRLATDPDSARLLVPYSPDGPCPFGHLVLDLVPLTSGTLRARNRSTDCLGTVTTESTFVLRRERDTLTTAVRPRVERAEFRITDTEAGPFTITLDGQLGALLHVRVASPDGPSVRVDAVATTLAADGALAFRTSYFTSPGSWRNFRFQGALRNDSLVGAWRWSSSAWGPEGSDSGVVAAARRAPQPRLVAFLRDSTSAWARVGEPVSPAPRVRVLSATGFPVAGARVRFRVATGGGTIVGAETRTDSAGEAQPGSWRLGPMPGSQLLAADVDGADVPGPAVTLGTAVPRALRLRAVSVGENHSCGVTDGGSTYCWGEGREIEPLEAVRGFSFTPRPVPTRVLDTLTLRQIRPRPTMFRFTLSCALTEAGHTLCWDGLWPHAPTTVVNAPAFTALSVGERHACGLTAAGAAYCWGENTYGQLGEGSRSSRESAVRVVGAHAFVALSAGAHHTCGLTTDGTARCWGANSSGQLGDGTTTHRATPVAVASSRRLTGLASGHSHTCAVDVAGSVQCWGWNGTGTLGDGTTIARAVPGPVASGSAAPVFVDVAAGALRSCAPTARGEAFCWAHNADGGLGDGTAEPRPTPTRVGPGLTFRMLSVGRANICGELGLGATSRCTHVAPEHVVGTGDPEPLAAPRALRCPSGIPETSRATGRGHRPRAPTLMTRSLAGRR